MKIIQVCNRASVLGGREVIAEGTTDLLKRRGHEVLLVTRDSRDLGKGLLGKMGAFARGIYSLSDRRFIRKLIRELGPDLIHVHGLHPSFSPWILVECQRACVPVVMTCHDYRLTCPTGFHLRNGMICERCAGGAEYWCVLKNCRGKMFESSAYALLSMVSRKLRLYADNVSVFIAYSEFVRQHLIAANFAEERIAFLPNMVSISVPDSFSIPSNGEYVAYVGRISPEKGIDSLLAAASQLPELSVQLAGEGEAMGDLVKKAPRNVKFLGRLDRKGLIGFYRSARFLVVPSIWFELFGLVAIEAMFHGLPVIAAKIGGLAELVEDGVTGFLFQPGNSEELAFKMKLLWENPQLCQQMGRAGREKTIREYGEDLYYKGLMGVYEKAIQIRQKN